VDRLLPDLAARRVLKRLDGPLDDTVSASRPISLRDLLPAPDEWIRRFTILMTQHAWTSPSPPAVCRDFWTGAYQTIDDRAPIT
jgi:hypothetical protein